MNHILLTTKYNEKLSAERVGDLLIIVAAKGSGSNDIVDLLFTAEQAEQLKQFLMEHF
jgi:hypothetical protein